MDIEVYNKANENIKKFISDWQLTNILDIESFAKLHEQLAELPDDYSYGDLKIGLMNAFNHIKEGDTSYIAKTEDSYHMFLWKLHSRIMAMQNVLDFDKVPEELKVFGETNKYFKDNDNYYVIICSQLVGTANGHISSIKVTEQQIDLEYNDHSPSRIYVLKERLAYKPSFLIGWNCSEIKVLKDVFPKEEGSDNYFFSAQIIKGFQYDANTKKLRLKELAELFGLLVSCDWFLCDADNYKEEDIEAEINALELALYLFDKNKIKPIDFIENVRKK